MWRIPLSAVLLSLVYSPAQAQWLPWAEDAFGERRSGSHERPLVEPRSDQQRSTFGEPIRDGGPRPEIEAQAPAVVAFPYEFAPSSIVIDTSGRRLYYVLGNNQAYMYPISVGREGFNWTGTETISRKQAWPDWYPPGEMRQRDPRLPEKMTGGTRNPLGAMALYLGTTLYRIHGTNDVKSIGQAQSSGCFRMMNAAVVHLASVAEVGTPVAVVTALPKGVEVSQVRDPARGLPPPDISPGGSVNAPMPSYDYRDLRDYTLRRR
jgi:lipoprotein-anchoring transpeptidase ErfK/SrfK